MVYLTPVVVGPPRARMVRPDGTAFVAMEEAEALAQARDHYGKDTPLEQDEDVLDTWFSSVSGRSRHLAGRQTISKPNAITRRCAGDRL